MTGKRKVVEESTSEAADVPHKAPKRREEVPLVFVGDLDESTPGFNLIISHILTGTII